MVFLVAAVSFIANNFTSFMLVVSFIEGYILIALTDMTETGRSRSESCHH